MTPPKECYIMFEELETVGVSLHLNQTSFIDRPLVVAPMHEEIMPDEQTAKTIGTPIQVRLYCRLEPIEMKSVGLLLTILVYFSLDRPRATRIGDDKADREVCF